jgi:hypothetical protein
MSQPIFHSDAERQVFERLRTMGLDVQPGRQIGGYVPDMIVRLKDGRTAVIEVKGWRSDEHHIDRALTQVRLYREALGADAGYIVMPQLDRGMPARGVLSLHDLSRLPELLAALPAPHTSPQPAPPPARPSVVLVEPAEARPEVSLSKPRKTIFAVMPFAAEFDDVFLVAMTHAAESIGATCKRVDREDFSGDIVQEIKSLIQQSAAVIVDLSGARPNVLYELGYAEGLGKPIVNICSSPFSELPFDVRNWNVLAYTRGQTYKLREPLARRLQAVVAKTQQSE